MDTNLGPSPTPEVTWRQPACLLESLPTDVLILIMSESNSWADLSSIIRASPLLFECFLSAKKTILLGIIANELGPVIRDAVALSLTEKLDWYQSGYYAQADDAIQKYEQLPAGFNSVKSITMDHVISMIHISRTIRFFVYLFSSSRLLYMHSALAKPLSATERQRVSQALIRYQLLMRIHPGADRGEKEALIYKKFFGLFDGWEMEQLAEAHVFIYRICGVLTTPKVIGRHRAPPPLPAYSPIDDGLYDLSALRRKILELCAIEPELFNRICAELQTGIHHSYGSYLSFLGQSHGLPTLNAVVGTFSVTQDDRIRMEQAIRDRDDLYDQERQKPVLVAGESATDPPYAWVDALNGLNCCRWGKDLPRNPPSGATAHQQIYVHKKMATWRWMGFVFWDRERVEILKTRFPAFLGYQTGWLIDVWEDPLGLPTESDDQTGQLYFDWSSGEE
ncbi:hypothetical protein F4677DRAFT_214813 [Hypoxylon crocopeplum]|nr:hypothetical protein F4677DRAFT_214813 [Hypoxylon crocopeplum]